MRAKLCGASRLGWRLRPDAQKSALCEHRGPTTLLPCFVSATQDLFVARICSPHLALGGRRAHAGREVAGELSAAGLHVSFAPPEERRGVGQDLVHVTIQIGSEAEAGLIGAAAVATVQRVVRAFKERHPEVDADAENDEDD